ncbi:WG repeat-containing protein [Paenibacillus sp. Marseille-P2973]|uniref:WG repeat-containing protein n=1 Tax=Paenibacillus sp. Marseille-P2973 TaxID=1871032 RepID=UPI001B35FDEC|nr:WG repeat-containing protein [Paenibacillus sp. Marseille-P2973]MBQ4900286.1 WG repeat-containing protein [Paenibacillus sp. Marseille-P2973]
MKSKVLASISVALLLIAGCGQKEEVVQNPVSEVSHVETGEPANEETAKMRLVEQGFEIEQLHTYRNEDVILFELSREGDVYYAMMDSNYAWVLQPTNEIKGIQYDPSFSQTEYDLVIYEGEHAPIIQDGLIALSVQDDRPREDDGLLWGYMNTKGEWVIKPQYRSVNQFSDGVAIVETIEEDRDDLQNSRTIAIDKEGNELFEISKHTEGQDSEDDSVYIDSFKNGYLKTSKGIYNKDGQLFAIDFILALNEVSDDFYKYYEVIGDQVVIIIDNKIKVFTLQGELVREFPYPISEDELEEEAGELSSTDLKLYTPKVLADSNQFIVNHKIMNLNGEVIFDGGNFLIQDDIIVSRSSSGEESAWNFYDLKGTPITDKNVVGIQLEEALYYNEPHWEKGNEYYKLISTKGEELIGEDRKISSVSRLGDRIVRARVTDPSTLDETDVLINTETLEFIKEVDL